MKKYVNISGFNVNHPNRGNAALSYGAISFLQQKGLLHEGQEIVNFRFYRHIFKRSNYQERQEQVKIDGKKWIYREIPVLFLEGFLCRKFGLILPFTRFGRIIKQVEYEAADYGGDGFSDIYGDRLFMGRMNQTFVLWKIGVPLIMLPQTIGPFKKTCNYDIAKKIMRYAQKIYVRDNRYIEELNNLGLDYERTKDLSAYMLPLSWDIDIKSNSVGINVSGLAYSNRFPNLEGRFDVYPELIDRLINHFRKKGCTVYLIPHSYCCSRPNENNDDMVACKMAFDCLEDKTNVVFVDKDLISPCVKYVISQMSFFIGTRMHANFAAIFTNVPLFGLAYSYKFQGAFEENGIYDRTVMISDIRNEDIDGIITKIDEVYRQSIECYS